MNDNDNDDDDVMAILTHSLARPQTGDDGLLCRGHGASSSQQQPAAAEAPRPLTQKIGNIF